MAVSNGQKQSFLLKKIMAKLTVYLDSGTPDCMSGYRQPPHRTTGWESTSVTYSLVHWSMYRKPKGKMAIHDSSWNIRFSLVIHLFTLLLMISAFLYVDCWTFYKAITPVVEIGSPWGERRYKIKTDPISFMFPPGIINKPALRWPLNHPWASLDLVVTTTVTSSVVHDGIVLPHSPFVGGLCPATFSCRWNWAEVIHGAPLFPLWKRVLFETAPLLPWVCDSTVFLYQASWWVRNKLCVISHWDSWASPTSRCIGEQSLWAHMCIYSLLPNIGNSKLGTGFILYS